MLTSPAGRSTTYLDTLNDEQRRAVTYGIRDGETSRCGPLLVIAGAGVGSLLLAYAGWSYVVARIGAARAGATMHLMPAIAVLLSALFLGELVTPATVGAALVVIACVVWAQRSRSVTVLAPEE